MVDSPPSILPLDPASLERNASFSLWAVFLAFSVPHLLIVDLQIGGMESDRGTEVLHAVQQPGEGPLRDAGQAGGYGHALPLGEETAEPGAGLPPPPLQL